MQVFLSLRTPSLRGADVGKAGEEHRESEFVASALMDQQSSSSSRCATEVVSAQDRTVFELPANDDRLSVERERNCAYRKSKRRATLSTTNQNRYRTTRTVENPDSFSPGTRRVSHVSVNPM